MGVGVTVFAGVDVNVAVSIGVDVNNGVCVVRNRISVCDIYDEFARI